MSKTSFILPFTLLLALPLFFFLFTHPVLPPKRLLSSSPNTLDDTSLFRQATHSTVVPRGKPKIAFLFLTNTDLHFAPLWQKYFTSSKQKIIQKKLYNIYVHAYPNFEDKYETGSVFKNRFIPAKKTERSSPTLISATRRLLATALLDDPLNYYFALVSETCIPLHSFSYTYKTLFGNKPTESTRSPTESTRVPARVSYIEVLSDEPQMWDRYIARGESVMMPEVPFTEFRVGSQFFILNRVHSLMVVKDRTLWKKFRLPCLNVDTCYPEEHYFPTLLSMKDPTRVSKDTLTRVDWTGSVGGHPRTYDPSEVTPEMIEELRGSNTTKVSYLFARKFSPECLPVLMDMADDVIFRD